MKKSIILAILFLALVTVSANAAGPGNQSQYRKNPVGTNNSQKPVGAPLDGGLLLILGGAGAAYYASKKRKASEEN
jgi:hypothetical protein